MERQRRLSQQLRRRLVRGARWLVSSLPSDLLWLASYERDERMRAQVEAHGVARPLVVWSDDYVSYNIARRGAYEPSQLLFIRDHVRPATGDGLAVDVGANLGVFTLPLSSIFRAVRAYEPAPDLTPLLALSLQMQDIQNVTVVPVALSDRPGNAVLERPTRYANNRGMGRLSYESTAEGCGVSVEVLVGDQDLENRTDRVRFVKIDVEGAEEWVLRGLAATLRVDRPIVAVEVLSATALARVEDLVPQEYQTFALHLGRQRRFKRLTETERSTVEHVDLVYMVPDEMASSLEGAEVPAFH